MPSEHVADQAEGLRRLLLRASARVLTVAAARAGQGATSLVVNLATTLAQAGKEVLVLDEHLSHTNVGNMLALTPRFDLLNVVRRDKSWREIMLHTQHGVRVLPIARALQALPQLSPAEREHLLECLAEASLGIDVVLVDARVCEAPVTGKSAHAAKVCNPLGNNVYAAPSVALQMKPDNSISGKLHMGLALRSDSCAGRHVCASLAPEQPLLLVLNATASSITASYALIKRMAMQDGRQSFGIVVNKVRDGQEAQIVFDNVAQVARRHLQVSVEYLGYVPADEKLKRATDFCRPVVTDFPSAAAARAFGDLGRNLMLLPVAGNEKVGSLNDIAQQLVRQARSPNMAHAT